MMNKIKEIWNNGKKGKALVIGAPLVVMAIIGAAVSPAEDTDTTDTPPTTVTDVTEETSPASTVPETTQGPTTTIPVSVRCEDILGAGAGSDYEECVSYWQTIYPEPANADECVVVSESGDSLYLAAWGETCLNMLDEASKTLTVEDVTITLFETGSECFNSAGAIVTWEPEVTTRNNFQGDALVVYDVLGGEFVETYNIELSDGSFSYRPELTSTESCTYELSAIVTDVRLR